MESNESPCRGYHGVTAAAGEQRPDARASDLGSEAQQKTSVPPEFLSPGCQPVTGPKTRRIDAKKRRPNLQHGLYTLKRAVTHLGSRALPSSRTALGRELRAWRDTLVSDLGGTEVISTQQVALVDLAVRTKLLIDSVDAYVLDMPSPVDKRHRRLWPVVRERQSLVGQLQSILRDLGLERRSRDVTDLTSYLAQRAPAIPAISEDGAGQGGTE